MKNFLRRHWRTALVSTTSLVLLASAGLVIYGADQIASPPRRELLEYHREFLDHPSAHGFRLDRFTASDGTPCLVCTPDPSALPGKRGLLLRSQLEAPGAELAPSGEIRGNLVLLHGRKGRKEDYLSVAERFCAAGFRCIIPDLPAHGENPGKFAIYGVREAALPARVLAEAAARFGFDPQPAGLIGQSMGGSVALYSAALPDAPWRALAVISTFDSLAPVIETQTAGYVGHALAPMFASAIAWLYFQKTGVRLADIRPGDRLAAIRVPTLIAHGAADRTIPFAIARRNFAALPTAISKTLIEIPTAGHDNVLVTDYPIYADLAAWMLENVAGK